MYSAKVLLTVNRARLKWRGTTDQQRQRLLAMDRRMEMKYFVNETTWIERLRFYFIKNQRTSYRFRLFNFLIKILSVMLYVGRAAVDDPQTTDCCGMCSRNWTGDTNPSWKSEYDFSWTPIIWVNRGLVVWSIQIVLAVLSSIYTFLLTMLQYKGNLMQLVFTVNMLIEIICTWPFLATLAWPVWWELHCIFVPVFLNVWLASSGLSNIMNDLQRATQRHKSALFNQLCILFATLISLLLTCICFVQHLERSGKNRMDMFDATWFVVVTFSTVGYGDITPTIWPSKVVVIFTIVVALAVLPGQIEQIATLWNDKMKEGSTYSRQRANTEKHVVVCATSLRLDTVMEFLNEFYAHPLFQNFIVILLSPTELDDQLKQFLQVPIWAERVTYIKGSVLLDEDLYRVKLDAAEACFLFTSRLEINRKAADENTILRAMACKNYSPNCPLYIQVLRPETKTHLQFADQIICDEEFKYALLSMNCYIPAISTVITLLAHTSKGEEGCRHPIMWKRRFSRSAGNEIYSVTARDSKFYSDCIGLRFPYASQLAHARYGSTLIALKRKSNIQINPGLNCMLEPEDILFYMCITSEDDAVIVGKNSLPGQHGHIDHKNVYSVLEEGNHKPEQEVKIPLKTTNTGNDSSWAEDGEIEQRLNHVEIVSSPTDDESENDDAICMGFPPYFTFVAHTISHVPTICHILKKSKKHCCLRLDRACCHCPHTNATQYGWSQPPIIICVEMACDSLTNVMIPLRAHYRPRISLHPVVFLLENVPEEIFLESISCFPDVYFLIGHMDDLDSLLISGTMNAHTVIVLDRQTSKHAEEEYMADSRQIVALQKLNKFFPGVPVCLELTHTNNQRFMDQGTETSGNAKHSDLKKIREIEASCSLPYMFHQSFAGGKAFCTSMIDTLLYQSLVKENITTLLRLMLGLQYSAGSGYLATCTVTKDECGLTYSQMFKKISCTNGGLLLGIYRLERKKGLKEEEIEFKESGGSFNRTRRISTTIKRSLKSKFSGAKTAKKLNMSLRRMQVIQCNMTERESLDQIIKNRMRILGISSEECPRQQCGNQNKDDENFFGYVMLNPSSDTILTAGDVVYILMPEIDVKSHTHQLLSQESANSIVEADVARSEDEL